VCKKNDSLSTGEEKKESVDFLKQAAKRKVREASVRPKKDEARQTKRNKRGGGPGSTPKRKIKNEKNKLEQKNEFV